MLSVLDSVQSIHLWRRSTKFSKWREYEWKYSIIFHNMDHFPSNWEYCWAENNVQRTSLCRMLVDHFNAYHCYYNYAGCWFQPIPFQKCQTIKNWFAPPIKTSSLCFSEQLSNIINENRVVGYHIKSKSWSSLWTNSILKK